MKVLKQIVLLFLVSLSVLAQQRTPETVRPNLSPNSAFEIKGKIKGLRNTEVYLAHYFGASQQVIKDTAQVDSSGNFVFQGHEALDEGLYLVSFNKNKYFDLVVGNAKFSFEPVLGETYHMYLGDDGIEFLSLIAPHEWNKEFIASFKLNSDKKWIVIAKHD